MIINAQLERSGTSCGVGAMGVALAGGITGVSMVVVDELHNLEHNGSLERLLAKVGYSNSLAAASAGEASGFRREGEETFDSFDDLRNGGGGYSEEKMPGYIQVVACSATIPNCAMLSVRLLIWSDIPPAS